MEDLIKRLREESNENLGTERGRLMIEASNAIKSLIDRSDSEVNVKAEYVTKKEFDAMAEVVKHHIKRLRQLEEKNK